MKLVELNPVHAYDKAIVILQDLHDLAAYQSALPAFQDRIRQMQMQYSKRPGFLRLQKANLDLKSR